MKKIFAGIFSAVIFLASPAHAANVWTGAKTLTKIEVGETGGFILFFDSTVGAGGCTSAGTNSLYIFTGNQSVTDLGQQSLLSLALTAYISGKKVNVMYDDSNAACWGKYIIIQD